MAIVKWDKVEKWLYRGKFHKAPKNRIINESSLRIGPGDRLAYTFRTRAGKFAYPGKGKILGPYTRVSLYGKGKNINLFYGKKIKGALRYFVTHRKKRLGPFDGLEDLEFSPNLKRIAFVHRKSGQSDSFVNVDGKSYGPYSKVNYIPRYRSRDRIQFTSDSRQFYFQFVRDDRSWLNVNGREFGPFERQNLLENVRFGSKINDISFSYGKSGPVKKAKKQKGKRKEIRKISKGSGGLTNKLKGKIRYFLRVGKRDFGPYAKRPGPFGTHSSKAPVFYFYKDGKEYINFHNKTLGPYEYIFRVGEIRGKPYLKYIQNSHIYFVLGSKILGKFKRTDKDRHSKWRSVLFDNGNYFFFIQKDGEPLISFKDKSTFPFAHMSTYQFHNGNPYYIDYKNPRLVFMELKNNAIVLRQIIPPQ